MISFITQEQRASGTTIDKRTSEMLPEVFDPLNVSSGNWADLAGTCRIKLKPIKGERTSPSIECLCEVEEGIAKVGLTFSFCRQVEEVAMLHQISTCDEIQEILLRETAGNPPNHQRCNTRIVRTFWRSWIELLEVRLLFISVLFSEPPLWIVVAACICFAVHKLWFIHRRKHPKRLRPMSLAVHKLWHIRRRKHPKRLRPMSLGTKHIHHGIRPLIIRGNHPHLRHLQSRLELASITCMFFHSRFTLLMALEGFRMVRRCGWGLPAVTCRGCWALKPLLRCSCLLRRRQLSYLFIGGCPDNPVVLDILLWRLWKGSCLEVDLFCHRMQLQWQRRQCGLSEGLNFDMSVFRNNDTWTSWLECSSVRNSI